MKFIFALMIALSLLVFSGCASQKAEASKGMAANPGQGGGEKQGQAASPGSGDASAVGQEILPESETKTPITTTNEQPAPGPKLGQAQPIIDPCDGKSGAELVECKYGEAKAQKDVAICATLAAKDGRFRCITLWCGSEVRDFSQCEKLAGDDRLGCLNKCNPNSNT